MADELSILAPSAWVLATAVMLDFALGDPRYAAHPVRTIGRTLSSTERLLRAVGADGYVGGVLLCVTLSLLWAGGISVVLVVVVRTAPMAAWLGHLFVVYSFLALGDLLHHGGRIERAVAGGDLPSARTAVSMLVGRDTSALDQAGCRRAAVESLGESLVDGFVSPLAFYVAGGIPGLALFKIVSTMDSMVGYKTARYRRFGWCGARLDDVMNFVPARFTCLLLAAVAAGLPEYSARKALGVGLAQHAMIPGPNAGWSEAALAGALERRLVGPIWRDGHLVTDVWVGDPADPPLATADDYRRASTLVAATGIAAAVLACLVVFRTGV